MVTPVVHRLLRRTGGPPRRGLRLRWLALGSDAPFRRAGRGAGWLSAPQCGM